MNSLYNCAQDEENYLSEEEIDSIDNFYAGLQLLKKSDVLLSYVNDLDDVKEILRLKYHPLKMTRETQNPDYIYTKYSLIMKAASDILDKIKLYLEKEDFQSEFRDMFKLSETIFNKQVEELERLIKLDRFPILIAGEAKAGKSTFINMLLGKDILPMNVVTCTTSICEIHNSQAEILRVHKGNQSNELSTVGMDEETLQRTIMKQMEESERLVFDYPVDFLNDCTFLVDSPGIGDNAALENITFQYLNSKTPAFIFVLNSTNSDGLNIKAKELITKARSQLEKQIELLDSNEMDDFTRQQMSKAVFVLNHWDVVKANANDEKEVEEVRQKVIEEVRRLWHVSVNDPGNIFFISARQAKEWNKSKIVRKEVLQIRRCLEELVGRLYEKNLSITFFLIREVLAKIESLVLKRINSEVDHKFNLLFDRQQAQDLATMLRCLEVDMPERKKRIKDDLEHHMVKMVSHLTLHLKSSEVQQRMLLIQKPVVGSNDSVDIMTMVLRKLILEELEKVIKEWNVNHNQMDTLTKFLEDNFDHHLREIGREISVPCGLIDKDTLMNAWNSTNFRSNSNADSELISKIEKIFIVGTVTLLFPVVALAGLLATPLILNHIHNSKKASEKKMEIYRENPVEYFNSIIRSTLSKLTDEDVKRVFFRTIYNSCVDRIEAFGIFISTEIGEKLETIKTIDTKARNIPLVMSTLNRLLDSIEDIFGQYHEIEHIHCPDKSLMVPLDHYIGTAVTEIPLDSGESLTKSCIYATGKYSTLFSYEDQNHTGVVFKTYSETSSSQSIRQQIQEIHFLNKTYELTLKCKNFCYNRVERCLVVVFQKTFDTNLQKYLESQPDLVPVNHASVKGKTGRGPAWSTAFRFVLSVGQQLCKALSHLHNQPIRMMHPDLQLGTILVQKLDNNPEHVNIYLFDACTNLKELRMGGYTKSNIFNFGLILYQMAFHQNEKYDSDMYTMFTEPSSLLLAYSFDSTKKDITESLEDSRLIDWKNPIHNCVPSDFNDMIKMCIVPLPKHQPNINACMRTIEVMKSHF